MKGKIITTANLRFSGCCWV